MDSRERSVWENHLEFRPSPSHLHPVMSERSRMRLHPGKTGPLLGRRQRLFCIHYVPRLFWGHSARNTVDWAIVGLGNDPNFRINDREGWTKRAKGLDNRWCVFESRLPQATGLLQAGTEKCSKAQSHLSLERSLARPPPAVDGGSG